LAKGRRRKRGGAEEGPCPFLPRKRRGAMMLAAMYPATKLRSPRATASSSPQSAQQKMRLEKTLLPLVDEHNHGPATASLSRRVKRHYAVTRFSR
jgi:hypothetical protein